jgi:hypothetical protein
MVKCQEKMQLDQQAQELELEGEGQVNQWPQV